MTSNIRRSIHRILELSTKINPTEYLAFKKLVPQLKDEPTLNLLKEYLTLPTHRRGTITINGFNEYKRSRSQIAENKVIITSTQNMGYRQVTHSIEIKKIVRQYPNKYYIHNVDYYIDGLLIPPTGYMQHFTNDNNEDDYIPIKNYSISFKSSSVNTAFLERIEFDNSYMGTDKNLWLPNLFMKSIPNKKKVIITTTAYDPVFITYPQLNNISIRQTYRDNENGTCIYDGMLAFFNNLIEKNENDTYAKAAYNKLVNNETEYKKEYDDTNIHLIGELVKASITIKDLINGNDKHFNVNQFNKWNIIFLNTRFNHLDITFNINEVQEVSAEKYESLKNNKFYIEKMGVLTIIKDINDKTDDEPVLKYNSYRKVKTEFNKLYNEYNNEVHLDELYLNKNSQARDLIGTYEYNLHKFFDTNMIIDNNLYEEIDQKMCYFSVMDKNTNKNFIGLPSGAFNTFKVNNNFDIDTYDDISNNKLIGFFEVTIQTIKKEYLKIASKLGLLINTTHTFTSPQINIFKKFMTFKFINVSYAPAVEDVELNEEWTERGPINLYNELTKKYETVNKGIKHYQKLAGILQREDETITTIIKPFNSDIEYYNIIKNDNKEIYKLNNGLIKIEEKKPIVKSYLHWFYFINSYCKCHILDVLFNLNNNIDDVVAVKVDAVVLKKGTIMNLIYNKEVFNIKLDKDGNTISNVEFILKKEASTAWSPDSDNETENDIIEFNENNEYTQNMNHYFLSSFNGLDDGINEVYTTNNINDTNDDNNTFEVNEYIYPVNSSGYFGYLYNTHNTELNINESIYNGYTPDIIKRRLQGLFGGGGKGKTSSVLRSNLRHENCLYGTSCWNLIQKIKEQYKKVSGTTWNNIIGKNCEPYKNKDVKYIIIDELTLIDKAVIDAIIYLYPHCIIFLIGDIAEKLHFQCKLEDVTVIKPSDYGSKLQSIIYTKSFRFDSPELERRLNLIRDYMVELKEREQRIKDNDEDRVININLSIKLYALSLFPECIKDIDDIEINDEDIFVSSLNEMKIIEEDRLTTYFINKGHKPRYYVKKTDKFNGILRGQRINEKPEHNNYEMKFFNTIHSVQGTELTKTNKIIIDLKYNFEFELVYTAFSRARREDQIIIIKDDKLRKYPRRIPTPPKKKNNKKIKEPEPEEDDEEEF